MFKSYIDIAQGFFNSLFFFVLISYIIEIHEVVLNESELHDRIVSVRLQFRTASFESALPKRDTWHRNLAVHGNSIFCTNTYELCIVVCHKVPSYHSSILGILGTGQECSDALVKRETKFLTMAIG